MKLHTKKRRITIKIEDVTVIAEPMTPREIAKLRYDCTDIVGRGDGAVQEFDGYEFSARMFERIVVSWDGATDEDGRPLECTVANKRAVYDYDQGFATQVLTDVKDKMSAREEAEEKN